MTELEISTPRTRQPSAIREIDPRVTFSARLVSHRARDGGKPRLVVIEALGLGGSDAYQNAAHAAFACTKDRKAKIMRTVVCHVNAEPRKGGGTHCGLSPQNRTQKRHVTERAVEKILDFQFTAR